MFSFLWSKDESKAGPVSGSGVAYGGTRRTISCEPVLEHFPRCLTDDRESIYYSVGSGNKTAVEGALFSALASGTPHQYYYDSNNIMRKHTESDGNRDSANVISRSKSVDCNATKMQHITMEHTTLESTPLSSLRSCSEFTKYSISKFDSRYDHGVGAGFASINDSYNNPDTKIKTTPQERGMKHWFSRVFGLQQLEDASKISNIGTVNGPTLGLSGLISDPHQPLSRSSSAGVTRRVTFRDEDSVDELSYMVESLSSRSTSVSSKAYSRSVSVAAQRKNSSYRSDLTNPEIMKEDHSPRKDVGAVFAEANDLDPYDQSASEQVDLLMTIGCTAAVDFKLNVPHRSSLMLLESSKREKNMQNMTKQNNALSESLQTHKKLEFRT